jgi:hypothetical protein
VPNSRRLGSRVYSTSLDRELPRIADDPIEGIVRQTLEEMPRGSIQGDGQECRARQAPNSSASGTSFCHLLDQWSRRRELNSRPADYEFVSNEIWKGPGRFNRCEFRDCASRYALRVG